LATLRGVGYSARYELCIRGC